MAGSTINLKYAILWGIIAWVLIFVEISILLFTPGVGSSTEMMYYIHFIVLPFITVFTAYMYFKNCKPSLMHGFAAGILFLIVGTILDMIITIPLFVKSYEYFFAWQLYAGLVELLVFSSLTGYYLGRKPKAK